MRNPALLLPLLLAFSLPLGAPASASETGFVVLVPDRGFLGNDEAREVFDEFHKRIPASVLAFATAERTAENLEKALSTLPQVDRIVVLPLFLTEHHALYRKARTELEDLEGREIRFASPFGSSYLAEEVLFDRVRALLPPDFKPSGGHGAHGGHGAPHGAGAAASSHTTPTTDDMQHGVPRLVVIGSGAGTQEDARAIETELATMARRAAEKFGLAEARVAVLHEWSRSDEEVASGYAAAVDAVRAASVHGPTIVVPFNLAQRLTTMMADWTRIEGSLQSIEGARFDGAGVIPHPNVARWLIRSANEHLPLAAGDVGVILVPHGSDYNWNEDMRAAMAPIRERYVTEDAFSMVDPFVVERAVRRLEDRGMKAAVLMRIFSLESSFQEQAEYVLGIRPEYRGPHAERISSHLRFATVGGMEAHPLLAEAMLDRALELSEDPGRETVVLVAHGTGGDAQNEHWMRNLESIAAHIRDHGPDFRDVRFHTWREDWPEKRKASIDAIRGMVEEASRDGGAALVVPVRTIGQGPESGFLEGLTYRHGTGFAPHDNFVRWLGESIEKGVSMLNESTPDPAAAAAGAPHSHH